MKQENCWTEIQQRVEVESEGSSYNFSLLINWQVFTADIGVDLIIKSCFTGAPRGHGDREDKFGTEVCQGAIFGVPGTFIMFLINNMDTHMMMLKTSHRLLKKKNI